MVAAALMQQVILRKLLNIGSLGQVYSLNDSLPCL